MKGLLSSSPAFPVTLSPPKENTHYCAVLWQGTLLPDKSLQLLSTPFPLPTALNQHPKPSQSSLPPSTPFLLSPSSPLPPQPTPHTSSSVSEPMAARSLKLRACRRVGARTLPNCVGGGASSEPNCEEGGARLFLLLRLWPVLFGAGESFFFKVLNIATLNTTE